MTDSSTIELSKFQKKADAYRRALNIAPFARSLEVVPMLAYLKGLCEALGIPRSKLKVVDFMSGDGHLSRILYRQGYRNITAIESCNEMSFGSAVYEKVKLENAPDALSGLRVIEHANPHVVVSLAAFHHLIETHDDDSVNLEKSVELQRTVVSEAFRVAPRLLLFFIVDLCEATRGQWGLDRWNLWRSLDAREAKRLDSAHHEKLADIYRSRSFADFSGAVDHAFLTRPKSAFALPWFREVVDPQTEVGHRDAAISDQFVKELSVNFVVNYRKYACPWHFDGDEQLAVFIQEKFGFSLGTSGKSPEDVRKVARERHLVLGRENVESFLWDLGILAVERPGLEFKKSSVVDRFYLFPLGFILFSFLFLISRLSFADPEISGWLVNGIFLMMGGSIRMLVSDEAVKHR